jgi:hypothetical protein
MSYVYCYDLYCRYMLRSKGFYDVYRSVVEKLTDSDVATRLSSVAQYLAIGPGTGYIRSYYWKI